MFVQDIYAQCQVLVKVGDGTQIRKLQSLVKILQDRAELPDFASSVLLCQEPSDELMEFSLAEVQRSCQFIHVQHRDTLVELLASPLGQGRRSLIIGRDPLTVFRLAQKLASITEPTKVVVLSDEDDELGEEFSTAAHLQTLLEKKQDLVSDIASLAESLDYKVF